MNKDSFWTIVGNAIAAAGADPEQKRAGLKQELEKLSAEDVFAFQKEFDQRRKEANTWELWAAAYIINGGCGDDTFGDFGCSLIMQGRDVFEKAARNPDSLAELKIEDPDEELFYEGFQYVGVDVYEAKTGQDMPSTEVDYFGEPTGEEWDEDSTDDLRRLCPKICEKYPDYV